MVMGNIFSSLFRFKTDSFDLRPDLATEYRVSPDGKTYTFKLRQGVKWHKGFGEFTAEDVAFSINRVKNPETKSPYARNFANVAKVEVSGKYEVKMALN